MNRSEFLRTGVCAAAAMALSPAAYPWNNRTGPARLVLVHLAGGNDGWNTFIPWRDDRYHASRPTLSLPVSRLHRVTEERAFHPQLPGVARLFREGELIAFPEVGYPGPLHGHFRSSDIWITGGDGYHPINIPWTSRLAAALGECASPPRMQAMPPAEIAAHIRKGFGTPVLRCRMTGFDTHVDQEAVHARRLAECNAWIGAWVEDLRRSGVWEHTWLCVYSEMGRTLEENRHGGTDHAPAGCLFIASGALRDAAAKGLRSLAHHAGPLDYRQVLGSLLRVGWNIDPQCILGNYFQSAGRNCAE